jgi:transmembrane sensor
VAPLDPAAALYTAADRARRSGHASEAAELLEKAVSSDGFGHRAAIACFTLGRLYLEELGKPAAAARAFDRSLLAGPPRGLEEDVRARLVEARTKMGDSEGARRAASEYRARFPGGRRAPDVERWSPGE